MDSIRREYLFLMCINSAFARRFVSFGIILTELTINIGTTLQFADYCSHGRPVCRARGASAPPPDFVRLM